MNIFVIEVYDDKTDRWIPMYHPCYSLEEAKKKQKTKKHFRTRVAVYSRVNWMEDNG